MTILERRVIDLAYKHKLGHLSSCLTALPIIDHIYEVKKKDEPFILSAGHSGLALYAVIEKHEGLDAEKILAHHGVHPDRCPDCHLDASAGSLGHGIGIAVGMALADRSRNVYVLLSDGEMAEGSVWEALNVASKYRLENLRVAVNANGFSAYDKTEVDLLDVRLQYFYPSLMVRTNMYKWPSYLNGLDGHYTVLTDEQYKEVIKL